MKRLEDAERKRILECAKKFMPDEGMIITFQKNAWNALRSEKDPPFSIALAKEGGLRGKLKSIPNVALFGVPPTRLSGPCRRILRQVISKQIGYQK